MAKQKGTQDRPYWSALVVDGEAVKLRLLAERMHSKTPVHVDWVRFTVLRRNARALHVDTLFPKQENLAVSMRNPTYRDHNANIWDPAFQLQDSAIRMPLDDLIEDEFIAASEAMEIALEVSTALGASFSVHPEPKKGQDFYKYRFSIELNGAECGWVGFLASSSSPNQNSQSKTLHVNLFGMACTFAESGWRERVADICDDLDGNMTRVDFALDFFDGLEGGIESIRQDYREGLCNVGGRKLKFNLVGDWENNHDRSLYIGSRDSGKITNAYEKGDQLYGEKFNSDWLRIELRYGNQVRVLCSDMLRRPADFFAGASDWHASMLLKAEPIISPESVARTPRLEIETVRAEVSRSVRWLKHTAAASMALAFEYLGTDEFVNIVSNQKLPGRLAKFSRAQIQAQMKSAFDLCKPLFSLTPVADKKMNGRDYLFTVDSCPAIA